VRWWWTSAEAEGHAGVAGGTRSPAFSTRPARGLAATQQAGCASDVHMPYPPLPPPAGARKDGRGRGQDPDKDECGRDGDACTVDAREGVPSAPWVRGPLHLASEHPGDDRPSPSRI